MIVVDVRSFLYALGPAGPFTAPGGVGTGGAGVVGTGSPQGVVTADPGTTYWDTVGQSLWLKDTGTGAVGWVQVVA